MHPRGCKMLHSLEAKIKLLHSHPHPESSRLSNRQFFVIYLKHLFNDGLEEGSAESYWKT